MLSVDIEKIIPVTEARDMFNKIIDEVEGSDALYVLTKNGKPAAVVAGINHLEKLTGETDTEVMSKVDQAGQKETTSDDFNTSDQFNTKDTVAGAANQAPAATQTLTEPVTPGAEPTEKIPAVDTPAETTGTKDDISFGDLPPNNPNTGAAGTSTDPFMPSSIPTPPEENQANPPGSSGGVGENPASTSPATNQNLSTDPMAEKPSQPSDNNPTPPTPQV